MKKNYWLTLAGTALIAVGGGAVLAQGPPGGQPPGQSQGVGLGPPPLQPEPGTDVQVITGEVADHGDASGLYAGADSVDSVTLPEGDWKITASGAANLDAGDPIAFNCGLRIADAESESGYTMLAKQNAALGAEGGRVGFAVTGALSVEGEAVDVDLVCYGGGVSQAQPPFEHNLVAIGG